MWEWWIVYDWLQGRRRLLRTGLALRDLLRRHDETAFMLRLHVALDDRQKLRRLLGRVEDARQRALLALLLPSASISRYLKSSLELAALDLDHVHEARLAPRASLQDQTLLVLARAWVVGV